MQSKPRGIRAESLELTYGSKASVCRLAWSALLDPNADSIPDDAVRSARTLKEIQLNDNNLKATFESLNVSRWNTLNIIKEVPASNDKISTKITGKRALGVKILGAKMKENYEKSTKKNVNGSTNWYLFTTAGWKFKYK